MDRVDWSFNKHPPYARHPLRHQGSYNKWEYDDPIGRKWLKIRSVKGTSFGARETWVPIPFCYVLAV